MTTDADGVPQGESAQNIDEVRADIAATRAELSQTVDALGEKLDVKQRARTSVTDARRKVAGTATRAKQSVPEPVQQVLDRAGNTVAPLARKVAAAVKPHRVKIIAGVAVAASAGLVARRRAKRST